MRTDHWVRTGFAKVGFTTFMLASACVAPAAAQSVSVLGDFRDWSAYTANDGAGVICFAVSKPKSTSPEPENYGETHIYVTNRVADGIRVEFNLISGYQFAPDSTATANISGNIYELYTQGDSAWLKDISQASNFAGSLRAGSQVIVEGNSDRGIKIVQTFSLSGATAAQRAIDAAC